MGHFSNLTFYERYHFIDYRRSLERGIGICGDASMVYSQIMDRAGIDNKIIAFPGHVVVEVDLGKQKFIADPDFGVFLDFSARDIKYNFSSVINRYTEKGYTSTDTAALLKSYSGEQKAFRGVKGFLTKRYFFEYVSYALKWIIPISLVLIPFLFRRKRLE